MAALTTLVKKSKIFGLKTEEIVLLSVPEGILALAFCDLLVIVSDVEAVAFCWSNSPIWMRLLRRDLTGGESERCLDDWEAPS